MSLATLASLANQQFELEIEIENAEQALAKLKERYRQLCENDIPELMQSLDVTEFKTANGLSVTVNAVIRASITKDNLSSALNWLRAFGHEKIIKNEFVLKPKDEEINVVQELLAEANLPFVEKSSVHHSTLRAWVREMLESGQEVPEYISIHRQMVSKVVV